MLSDWEYYKARMKLSDKELIQSCTLEGFQELKWKNWKSHCDRIRKELRIK